MNRKQKLDDEAAAELPNRLAKQIIEQIVKEPIAACGSLSDVMTLCESVRKRCGGATWRHGVAL